MLLCFLLRVQTGYKSLTQFHVVASDFLGHDFWGYNTYLYEFHEGLLLGDTVEKLQIFLIEGFIFDLTDFKI